MEAHHASSTLWQLHVKREHPDSDRCRLCNDKQTDKRKEAMAMHYTAQQADMGIVAGHRLEHEMHIFTTQVS